MNAPRKLRSNFPRGSYLWAVRNAQWQAWLDVEAAPLEKVAADLLQVSIAPTSKMHGVEVGELRLPPGASVSLVIRDGDILVPERRTVLRHGDDLVVVTPRKVREQAEERLRQVSQNGRLAHWLVDKRGRSGNE